MTITLNELAISVPREYFKEAGRIFRMGRSPIRIELLNQASGIDFKSCYERCEKIDVDGTEISIISATDLLVNKKASGREKNIADLKSLEKILGKNK